MFKRPLITLAGAFFFVAIYHAVYESPLFIFAPSALFVCCLILDQELMRMKERLVKLESSTAPPETAGE